MRLMIEAAGDTDSSVTPAWNDAPRGEVGVGVTDAEKDIAHEP